MSGGLRRAVGLSNVWLVLRNRAAARDLGLMFAIALLGFLFNRHAGIRDRLTGDAIAARLDVSCAGDGCNP